MSEVNGKLGVFMRLDKRVAEQFGLSRRAGTMAVQRGQVDVAGQTCLDPARSVEPITPVAYNPGRPRPETTARRLRVLFEDRDILIVDKPAGVLTQPTPDRERDTLIERAGRYLAHKRGIRSPYVGIVHRIDKLTSGVILLVCAPRALRPFQSLFRSHAIERSYLAVVDGVVQTSRGTIDRPLVADRGDGRRGTARRGQHGVPAITHYEVIEKFGVRASLLTCRLETGRTHQIRIHLAEIGHPVVGDPVYGRKGSSRFPAPFPRQALHAQALGFVHPMSGQALRIEAPLPTDMKDLIAGLRERFGSER
jgi:23S rRNA pseudouridine1911/1915/1917 synthase